MRLGPLVILAGILLAWMPPTAHAEADDPGFLTAPSAADPLDITIAYLRGGRTGRGATDRDIAASRLTSRRVARRTGATHLHLQQRAAGIDVLLAGVDSTVDRDGRLVAVHDSLVRGLEGAVVASPRVSPVAATRAAADDLGLAVAEPLRVLDGPTGAEQETRISRGGVSLDDIPAKLVWVPIGETDVRLAWSVVLRATDRRHWWQIIVDAADGEILRRYDWTAHDSYRVHRLPLSNPEEGARTLEVDPADLLASPFGWHDVDGIAGADSNVTVGNNVRAQEDRDANEMNGANADGGPTRLFDFPFDDSQAPELSEPASITQLFYLNNVLHDVFYRYGFDEAAGNFQMNNYGRGGTDLDRVVADTLDGAMFNNANFSTPPDGEPGHMQMFVFRTVRLTVNAPAPLAGPRAAGGAAFGPFAPELGLTGDLVLALDPSDAAGPSVRDACSPLTNGAQVAGKVALVERGTCDFVDKVRHAQHAGAVAAVVYNNDGDGLLTMGGTDPSIVIPSLFVGASDGVALRDALPSSTVTVTLAGALRDSSFDNEIVIHEYAHGVTNRLTGGPANVLCLQYVQSGGLGEGWSDFFGLAFTHKAGATRTDPRTMAAYSLGDSLGPGLRSFPYSTDPAINPLTLANLPDSAEVHDIGEIWATVLWEMYWDFVDLYGFDPNLGDGVGGNDIAVQLVMDALAIQPCSPTFTSARNAILQADLVSHGGAHRCLIWKAFARRGVGTNADAGVPYGNAGVPSFVPPPDCVEPTAQDARQRGCIYAMNESLRKVMEAQGKSQRQCLTKHAANSLATSAEVCLIADPSGLFERARVKAEGQEQRRCTVEPAFGKTNADTVAQAGFGAELGLVHDVFGPNVDSAVVRRAIDPVGSRCQLDVVKRVAACRSARLRAFNRCKKEGLKAATILQPAGIAACLGDDPRGTVAKACDPVVGKIATKSLAGVCGDASLDLSALFPGCDTDDRATLAECLDRSASCRTCAAAERADWLDTVIDCDLFDNGVSDSSCGPLP